MTNKDFEILQNSEWSISFVFRNNDRSPMDLIDFTAKMQIREFQDSTSILFDDLSTTNSRLIFETYEGKRCKLNIIVPSGVSKLYTFIHGFYDLQLIDPTGKIYRKIQGKIKINKNTTD